MDDVDSDFGRREMRSRCTARCRVINDRMKRVWGWGKSPLSFSCWPSSAFIPLARFSHPIARPKHVNKSRRAAHRWRSCRGPGPLPTALWIGLVFVGEDVKGQTASWAQCFSEGRPLFHRRRAPMVPARQGSFMTEKRPALASCVPVWAQSKLVERWGAPDNLLQHAMICFEIR